MPDGVTVAQQTLDLFVMVQIHVGQPTDREPYVESGSVWASHGGMPDVFDFHASPRHVRLRVQFFHARPVEKITRGTIRTEARHTSYHLDGLVRRNLVRNC